MTEMYVLRLIQRKQRGERHWPTALAIHPHHLFGICRNDRGDVPAMKRMNLKNAVIHAKSRSSRRKTDG
jgi:hypothetical protein